MSNFITYDPSLNATVAEKAADALGTAAAWTADAVQDVAFGAGALSIAAYARTERVVVQLANNRSAIYQAAAAKADARIAARLARRGIKVN